MMCDLTLVIPTANRPELFAALLSYLEAEKPDCRVLVLDSSRPQALAVDHARVAESCLDIELAKFPDADASGEWRRGINKVTTPFCTLCMDDDLVVLEGLHRCLETYGSNPAASAVVGRSFTFLARPDGDMELRGGAFGPSISDASPLERLGRLFQQYQAPSRGVFRTPVLQRIFDAMQPMTKPLSRELLLSALTVIEGRLVRVPDFSYASNLDRSAAHDHGDLLEWFCNDPDSLVAEYLRYREITAAAVLQRPDNIQQHDEVHDLLDLIHLRYFARHAPDSILEFFAEQQIAGVDFADYWQRRELHLAPHEPAAAEAQPGPGAATSLSMRGRERSYLLSSDFYAPQEMESPPLKSVVSLLAILDNYRPRLGNLAPNASRIYALSRSQIL
jgi:glycosyltransferase domain-containing protein